MEPGTCPPCASQHRPAPPLVCRPPAGPLSPVRKQTLEGVSHVAGAHSCTPAWQGLPEESHPVLGQGRGEKGGI